MEKSLHSTEKELVEAFTSHELICFAVQKNEELASVDFRKIIFRCAIVCSIKNKPDELTVSVLWDYTKKNLGNYTYKEIEKAFIFNQSGQLADTVEHFQAFDIAFFSKVMELWLILKSQTRSRIAALLPKPKESEPETPEQRYQGLLNYINKNNSFPDFWSWNEVYNYMDENDLIKDTNAEKKELFNQIEANFRVKMELDLMEIRDFIERDTLKSGHIDRVKAECRKLTVLKALQHLIQSK